MRLLPLLLALLVTPALAADLQVDLRDRDGKPLGEAVLWITPGPAAVPPQSIMDQKRRTFVPYILAVQRGTQVRFPNSDPINHHVYSFSPTKRFELRLHHQGDAPQDVLFDQPGLVTLGCNIHDWMLGFILVVDTPWFAQTDAQGIARLSYQPAPGQQLHLWHPRITDPADSLVRAMPADSTVNWQLNQPLKRDPRPKPPRGRPGAKGTY